MRLIRKGFTLAELLIALAILGVIATFTIPKVLQSQQDGKSKAIAKEAASAISAAYSAYKLKNVPGQNTGTVDLTPYLNYVAVQTTGSVDSNQVDPTPRPCSGGGWACLKLHNGAVLHYATDTRFGGTATTNAIWFGVDPDGNVSADNQTGKSLFLFLYYSGKLKTFDSLDANTQEAGWTYTGPCGSCDPPWFSWN